MALGQRDLRRDLESPGRYRSMAHASQRVPSRAWGSPRPLRGQRCEDPSTGQRQSQGRVGSPRLLRVLRIRPPCPVSERKRSIGIGPAHRLERQPSDGSRLGQPYMARGLRRRTSPERERFRIAFRSTLAPRASRRAGPSIHRAWLEYPVADPRTGHDRSLPKEILRPEPSIAGNRSCE